MIVHFRLRRHQEGVSEKFGRRRISLQVMPRIPVQRIGEWPASKNPDGAIPPVALPRALEEHRDRKDGLATDFPMPHASLTTRTAMAGLIVGGSYPVRVPASGVVSHANPGCVSRQADAQVRHGHHALDPLWKLAGEAFEPKPAHTSLEARSKLGRLKRRIYPRIVY